MEEIGDPEKHSMGIFYNNVKVYVERMPGNGRVITAMRVYDAMNNRSATVNLLRFVLDEEQQEKRSICTRLVEMTGRTRQNTDYRLEKNASVTVSERKSDYCISALSGTQRQQAEKNTENRVTRKPAAFEDPMTVNDNSGKSLAAYWNGESKKPKAEEIAIYGNPHKKAGDNKNLEKGKKTPIIGVKKKAITGETAKKPYLGGEED